MAMRRFVPIAQGQATQAVAALLNKPTTRRKKRRTTATRTKRRTASPRRKARTKATRRKKKPARLVKGSAAAKRHMAKLRRMQKRR